MASYIYVAVTPGGKQKKGTIDAANEEAVKSSLKAQDLIPISITESNALNKDISFKIGKKVSPRDLSVFCKQFQSILHAGVTVIQALSMMAESAQNKYLKKALDDVKTLVEKGENLADAMRSQEDIFPPILVNMVEAGEASGSLETSFERMSTHFEKSAKTQGMIRQAMIYPCVLLVVIIAVVAIMLIKIIPGFEDTFADTGTSLPAITLIVMAMSRALIRWWPVVLLVVIVLIFAIRMGVKTETGAILMGRLTLRIPLVGNLVIKSSSAQLARTLSTLMSSGISVVSAIEIVGKIMSNRIVQKVLEEAKKDVERGVPLSQPLEASGTFPPLLYNMTHIGEETGNMEEMLEHAASFYEEEVEEATKAVTAVMEPAIIVVMACVVVPIMLAIMMPMMSIYSAAENS